jgi:hypothetical protein
VLLAYAFPAQVILLVYLEIVVCYVVIDQGSIPSIPGPKRFVQPLLDGCAAAGEEGQASVQVMETETNILQT